MEAVRQRLETAACEGDSGEIRRLFTPLAQPLEPYRTRLLNRTLGISCREGRLECVTTALALGADPNSKCEDLEFLPLFFAVRLPQDKGQDWARIIDVLVGHGADIDARDEDHNGSNALMWATSLEAVDRLLSTATNPPLGRKDDIDYLRSRDNDGKTALIWSVITHRLPIISQFLARRGDASDSDDQGNTPLHWAARENNLPFVKFLRQEFRPKTTVNVINHGGRTPLHLAIGKNRREMVNLLLDYDAEDVDDKATSTLDVESAGGWLPLHVPCGNSTIDPTMADILITKAKSTHLIQPTGAGKTPMIIAAEHRNIGVMELLHHRIDSMQDELERERERLLQRQKQLETEGIVDAAREMETLRDELRAKDDLHRRLLSARGIRDYAGNIALFNPGICQSPSATNRFSGPADFLAPWYLKHVLPLNKAREPARHFQAKIVDLSTVAKKIDVGRISVHDLIYTDLDHSHGAAKHTLPRKPCKYRWIHLPANKRSWCRDLFAKYYLELWEVGRIDESKAKHPDQPATSRANGQNALDGLSKTYTAEHFQKLARTLILQRIGTTAHSAYMAPGCRAISPGLDDITSTPHPTEPTFLEVRDDEGAAGESLLHKLHSQSTIPKQPGNHVPAPEGQMFSPPSLCLYMPYLHFEYFDDLAKMKQALRYDPLVEDAVRPGSRAAGHGPYSKLLFTGTHGEQRDYHPRRTLDQYLYRSIPTDQRDLDQVVFRYQSETVPNGLKMPASTCKVIMVDELWMWVLSEDFIVTSFPTRFEQGSNIKFDVWETVMNDITARGLDSVPTVYDLAALITRTCSEAFDFGDTAQPRFIDMFEASLGNAMEGAMSASRELNQASAQGSKWLRTVGDDSNTQFSPSMISDTTNEGENEDDGMEFVDRLLDLRKETDLIYQISDTSDEIDILSTVLTSQKRVLEEMSSMLASNSQLDSGDRHDSYWGVQRGAYVIRSTMRTVDMRVSELKRMAEQADRIYKTVTNVLDMKQKYANAIEARSVRAGGLTFMVFTVATVFFLPASFILNFFELNLSDLPHVDANGAVPSGVVYRWVLGLGLGVALLYLAVAFQFRPLLRRAGFYRMRRWVARGYRNVEPPRSSMGSTTLYRARRPSLSMAKPSYSMNITSS